jgi:CheY-like chemotaxis protein
MKKLKILLVEDDNLDIISVQRSMKGLGIDYELQVASNGREALNMLKSTDQPFQPKVILLDLNMPRMNGIEFLRALRQDEALQHIKVFIMTTSAESNDRAEAEKLGISGFIIKPLNYTDNLKRVDSMDAFVQFHLRKIFAEET